MNLVCAMVTCCLYAVVTMEAQVTVALVVSCWRSAPGRRVAPELGWKLTDAVSVFFATYALAYLALSLLAPCQCYPELIAAGVAGVVNLAITACNIPLRPVEG